MDGMQIDAVNDFAADPAAVFAMLTDEEFLTEVCVASGALDFRVASTNGRTAVERTLNAPSAVQRFVGQQLTITEVTQWGDAAPDGSRSAALSATVAGMPVSMAADVDLRPGGRGTLLTYAGRLTIAIPLFGRKLEEQAAPALLEGLGVQQRVGDQRLGD